MAWIKFETTTPEKPEIWDIAVELNLDHYAVVGRLLDIWSWFDQHTTDGNAPSVTKKLLDRRVGVSGFCDAMISVGWLRECETDISIVNFEAHNGKTAKGRAVTAKRQELYRNSLRSSNADSVTNVTDEASKERHLEKEKEKDNKYREKKSVDPNHLTKKQFVQEIVDRGVDPDIASEWFAIRKLKRAVFSLGAIERTEREAEKAKIPFVKAIEICVAKGWRGFEAQYLDGDFSTTKKEPTPPSRKILNRDLPPELLNRIQG